MSSPSRPLCRPRETCPRLRTGNGDPGGEDPKRGSFLDALEDPDLGPRLRGDDGKEGTGIMAILNLTPDSFSDGGALMSPEAAVHAAGEALAMGADILDVGGESTRPGAEEISIEAELQRVIPGVAAIHQAYPEAFISVDTRKAAVAEAALAAGARMVNDVSGLQFDPNMAEVVAQAGAYLVIMHSQGTPQTMQQAPHYPGGVVEEVSAFFARQAARAIAAGVASDKILLDPGFGFGKTLDHNFDLLRNLSRLKALGFPLLVGTSRKSFLTLGQPEAIPPAEREALTAASLVVAIQQGAEVVRVHDVKTQGPVIRWADSLLS